MESRKNLSPEQVQKIAEEIVRQITSTDPKEFPLAKRYCFASHEIAREYYKLDRTDEIVKAFASGLTGTPFVNVQSASEFSHILGRLGTPSHMPDWLVKKVGQINSKMEELREKMKGFSQSFPHDHYNVRLNKLGVELAKANEMLTDMREVQLIDAINYLLVNENELLLQRENLNFVGSELNRISREFDLWMVEEEKQHSSSIVTRIASSVCRFFTSSSTASNPSLASDCSTSSAEQSDNRPSI